MNGTQSEEDIFLAAAEIAGPDQRAAYLHKACGENSGLSRRIEALLARHHASEGMLDVPPPGIHGTPHGTGVCEQPGTAIGPYELLEQIGEGGFGVVFLAEQTSPVRRKVALKIIKPGMDTREVIGRFEAERQALAMMDHPCIAKVFDAGMVGPVCRTGPDLPPGPAPSDPARQAGPTGRPYFVMELVQGVPITEYCDQCNLSTRERLELFVAVCQAVQHAHQKGVIHRDLKPTNVLVAMQDGRAMPKIIDFGVAKAIGDVPLTERTLTTAFAQMVGTPMYMSPEQAELSPLGVDTRSDIYSLGVLLYELLTGATPFEKERLHAASYDELRRIIREEEPPRPSARISTLAAALATTIAERRRTDARRLRQTIHGELDWIVMKCLEKDRNRRYDSAGSLARDVERYLDDEPVQACPPSAAYRFRKFAVRNKALLAAGGAIVAALVIGLGLATWMYHRAAAERDRAQTVSDFLQWVLASSDADEANAILRNGIDVYDQHDQEFADRPTAEAEYATSCAWFANYLASTGKQDDAKAVVRRAANHLAHAEQRGLAPPVHLKALYYLALAQLRLKDEAGYREACEAMFQVPINNDSDKTWLLWTWCLGAHPQEDPTAHLKQAEELVANYSANHDSLSARWVDLGVLGAVLYRTGQYEQAAERFKESLAAYPEDTLRAFRTDLDRQLFLAMANWQLGQRDEARRLLADAQLAMDDWLETTLNTWMRRTELELLRREAEALIEPKKPHDRVENDNPKPVATRNP